MSVSSKLLKRHALKDLHQCGVGWTNYRHMPSILGLLKSIRLVC